LKLRFLNSSDGYIIQHEALNVKNPLSLVRI